MIKIFEALDGVMVEILRTALEARGIACEVRGQYRLTGMGETPPNECWTELWLLDESQAEAARDVIARAAVGSKASWVCENCGELVQGSFDQCWNCQNYRPTPRETQPNPD